MHLRRNAFSWTRSPAVQRPDHAGAAYCILDSTVARNTSFRDCWGNPWDLSRRRERTIAWCMTSTAHQPRDQLPSCGYRRRRQARWCRSKLQHASLGTCERQSGFLLARTKWFADVKPRFKSILCSRLPFHTAPRLRTARNFYPS